MPIKLKFGFKIDVIKLKKKMKTIKNDFAHYKYTVKAFRF
jgi:hypothetical protein